MEPVVTTAAAITLADTLFVWLTVALLATVLIMTIVATVQMIRGV